MITKTEKLIENALGMDGFRDESAYKAIQKAFQLCEELKENDYNMDTLRNIAEREPSSDYTADKLSKIILSSILIVCKNFYTNGVLAAFHIDSHDDLHVLFNLMDAMKKHKEEIQAQINQRSVHQLNTDESTKLKQENKQLKEDIEKIKQLLLSTSEKLNSKINELDELKEKLASLQHVSDLALNVFINQAKQRPEYKDAEMILHFFMEPENIFSGSQQQTIREALSSIRYNFSARNHPLVVNTNNISGCNVMQGDIHLNKEY